LDTSRPRFRSGASPRGYTVLELMVVVGLALIFISMVASALSGMAKAQRLRSSTERVAGVIGLARSKAISDGAVFHVRIENRGPDQQWVAVYRFPKVSDAMRAITADVVEKPEDQGGMGGWKSEYLVDKQPLEKGVFFETQYDPDRLWDEGRARAKPISQVHANPEVTLYYSPYPSGSEAAMLPKTTPSSLTGPFPTQARLLYFLPDGTASGNLLLVIRDDSALNWVQVWKGGIIRTGSLGARADFEQVYQ
jgi:type II secretory pathway pseudopilin PulG